LRYPVQPSILNPVETEDFVTKLHSTEAQQRYYCGPTAISAVTGVLCQDIEKVVVLHRKYHPVPKEKKRRQLPDTLVRGMRGHEIAPVLKALGWNVVEHTSFSAGFGPGSAQFPTFNTWYNLHHDPTNAGAYIVFVGSKSGQRDGHFIAVAGGEMVDTKFRAPVPVGKGHGSKKVWAVYRVERRVEDGRHFTGNKGFGLCKDRARRSDRRGITLSFSPPRSSAPADERR
jgi:hypothetical protein